MLDIRKSPGVFSNFCAIESRLYMLVKILRQLELKNISQWVEKALIKYAVSMQKPKKHKYLPLTITWSSITRPSGRNTCVSGDLFLRYAKMKR